MVACGAISNYMKMGPSQQQPQQGFYKPTGSSQQSDSLPQAQVPKERLTEPNPNTSLQNHELNEWLLLGAIKFGGCYLANWTNRKPENKWWSEVNHIQTTRMIRYCKSSNTFCLGWSHYGSIHRKILQIQIKMHTHTHTCIQHWKLLR